MDEIYTVIFSVGAAWIAVEVLSKLFPENSGDLLRGIAVLTIVAVLIVGVLRLDISLAFQSELISYNTETDGRELLPKLGTELLRKRLHEVLLAAGIETEDGADGIEVRYRQFDNGEIEIDRVCVTLVYAADTDRTYALLRSVLTEAIPVEIHVK